MPDDPSRRDRTGAPESAEEPPVDSGRRDLLRYAWIGAVGVGLSVGGFLVVTSATRHERYDEGWDLDADGGSPPLLRGTVTLPSGRFAVRDLSLEADATYTVSATVEAGGPVDLFTLTRDQYDAYSSKDRVPTFVEALSVRETSDTTLTGDLPAGDYRVVVDNTGEYGGSPEGDVSVRIDVSPAG